MAKEAGRHFYLAKYGVLVRNRTNTLIVHRPRDAHRTLLPHRGPEVEEASGASVEQNGFSMLLPQGFCGAWRNFVIGHAENEGDGEKTTQGAAEVGDEMDEDADDEGSSEGIKHQQPSSFSTDIGASYSGTSVGRAVSPSPSVKPLSTGVGAVAIASIL